MTTCHSVHKNGPHGMVPRTTEAINEQCSKCHTDVWAAFQRPFKHRVTEGAMSCADCHNPHGNTAAKAMARTVKSIRADGRFEPDLEEIGKKVDALLVCRTVHRWGG